MRDWLQVSGARWLVPLAPALATLILILTYSNDVPHGDEWDTPAGLLDRITTGSASWEELFSQHNESRKAVPRAIFTLGTLLVGWHVVPYMVIGWLCALASLLLLLKMLGRDRRGEPGSTLLPGLLIALLLFSPIQAANQLWGIQMIVFIPPLCLVASLWIQTRETAYRNTVLACALFSLIAMFSFANGMLCWVLAFPLVSHWLSQGIPRERRGSVLAWTGVYLALASASLLFYFRDYHRPGGHPSLGAVLEDPALGIKFFATWLGAPFAETLGADLLASAFSAGTLLLLMLGLVSAWIIRGARSRSARPYWLAYYPWICLTAYGIVSGLVTTAGRAGWGQQQALARQYPTFALWTSIGLVGMITVLWRSQPRRRLDSARLLSLLVGGALGVLALASWPTGIERMQEEEHRTAQHLLTLRLLKVARANPLIGCPRPECLYPRRRKVLRRTASLSEAGVLVVDFIGPWLPEKLNSPTGSVTGESRIMAEGEKRIRIVGWAALPPGREAPDLVALARRARGGRLELVSGLIVKDHLGLEAAPAAGSDQRRVFFEQSLAFPPARATKLRLFAVDLSSEEVYRLPDPGFPAAPSQSLSPRNSSSAWRKASGSIAG